MLKPGTEQWVLHCNVYARARYRTVYSQILDNCSGQVQEIKLSNVRYMLQACTYITTINFQMWDTFPNLVLDNEFSIVIYILLHSPARYRRIDKFIHNGNVQYTCSLSCCHFCQHNNRAFAFWDCFLFCHPHDGVYHSKRKEQLNRLM